MMIFMVKQLTLLLRLRLFYNEKEIDCVYIEVDSMLLVQILDGKLLLHGL